MRVWNITGPDQEWFNKTEVCAYLDISARTLDRLIEKGLFPRGYRMSSRGRLRWSGLDLAVYVQMRSRCREGPAEKDAEETADDETAT